MIYKDFLREKFSNTLKLGTVEGITPLTLPKSKGKMLKDYRIYGNSVQVRLPKEYQEVEYIQNAGAAYIKTGIKAKEIDEAELTLARTSDITTQYYLGTRNSNNAAIGYSLYFTTHGGVYYYPFEWIGSGRSVGLNVKFTTRTEFKNGTDKFYYNDELIRTHSFVQSNYNIGNEIYLGAIRENNGGPNYLSYAKFYSVIMKKNGIEVANYIPCYRKSDNVVGMYDLVSGKFLYSAVSTQFTKGGDIAPTPENPIEIKSVGIKTNNLFDKTAERIRTKNDFDNTKIQYTAFNVAYFTVGDTITFAANPRTLYIPCQYGDNFIVKFFGNLPTSTRYYYSFIDKDNKVLQERITYTPNSILTVPEDYPNLAGITIEWALDDDANDGLMIVKSNVTPTSYEAYGYKVPVKLSNGNDTYVTNIYLNEPLRKIGDYTDYIDFKNKKIVRNVILKLFRDTDSWTLYRTNTNNCVYNLDNLPNVKQDVDLYSPMCSHFKQINTSSTASFLAGEMRFQMTGTTISGTRIYVASDKMDLDSWKNWLASNKPELIYIANEPTEETIDLPDIPTTKENCILDVDGIKPSNVYVKYEKR